MILDKLISSLINIQAAIDNKYEGIHQDNLKVMVNSDIWCDFVNIKEVGFNDDDIVFIKLDMNGT